MARQVKPHEAHQLESLCTGRTMGDCCVIVRDLTRREESEKELTVVL